MRALLINPAHPESFYSFQQVTPLLGKKSVLPPLGLLTVAALLPQDWDLKLVDLNFQQLSPADWEACDLVLISGMIVQRRGILENIGEGKRRGKTVVVGGPWAFHFAPDALRAGADLAVKGEGELAVPLLLESLARRESGRLIAPAGLADLKTSPPPRFDLINVDDYVDMAIQFSRGCPFKCEFCDITYMLGNRVRTKTPAQILTELQRLYDRGWRRRVLIVDDNFIGHPAKTRELLQEMVRWQAARGHPLDFYTQASVNLAAEPELLALMARAGFDQVFLGIETQDEESLKLTGKFQNVSLNADWVCRQINEAGIPIQAACIMGFDGESPGADRRFLDFALRNQIPEMFVTLLQALPGTRLWKRLKKAGRLLPLNMEHFSNNTALCNFVPTRSLSQIVEEFIRLYQELYEPGAYLERSFQACRRLGPLKSPKPFGLPYWFEVRTALRIVWRQGVRYPSRRRFWLHLATLLWKFPGRLRHFLTLLIRGEDYFTYRHSIALALRQQLAQLDLPLHKTGASY